MSRITLVTPDHETARPGGFMDAEEAYRRLQAWALDHDNLQHFREVWNRASLGGFGDPPSDRRVLQELAARLADRRLCLAGPPRRVAAPEERKERKPAAMPGRPASAGGGGPAPAGAAGPAAPMLVRPPTAPAAPQLPPAVTDFVQQAQCLLDAAASGAPFVEQCAQ